MSRIGVKPITVPAAAKVAINGNKVAVEGPKGKLAYELPAILTVSMEDNLITVVRPDDSRQSKAMHGLARSLVNNMVVGVIDGYEKKLEIRGVGFKAQMKGTKLILNVGYSHICEFETPAGLTITVPEPTKVTVNGADKQAVGQAAATIRGFKKPEPYKGKGIRYVGEFVAQKEGKKVG